MPNDLGTEQQQAQTRVGQEIDGHPAPPDLAHRYIPFPKAFKQLLERLRATPEELAAWVFMEPKEGGFAAYINANDLDPPSRFYFDHYMGEEYLSPLMACWFREDDLKHFNPIDRYITGKALIERWGQQPGIDPKAFVLAKISESRLIDLHPTFGGTRGDNEDDDSFPPLESGLFLLSHIEAIEEEDFGIEPANRMEGKESSPVVGSPEWRKQTAKKAANARYNQPGGSREKKARLRMIWASGKYLTRTSCAEAECEALGMTIGTAEKALRNAPKNSNHIAAA